MTLRPSMAIVLLIPMRPKFPDRVTRAEDARDLGRGQFAQKSAAHEGNVAAPMRAPPEMATIFADAVCGPKWSRKVDGFLRGAIVPAENPRPHRPRTSP